MIKSFFIGVVATSSLWSRLMPLLTHLEYSHTRIVIESEEPDPSFIYQPPNATHLWSSYIPYVQTGLLLNAGLPYECSVNLENNCYQWLQPRLLSSSEISVYFKHLQLYRLLANSDYDYALILEDDCLLTTGFYSLLKHITSSYQLDFVDLANGLSGKCIEPQGVGLHPTLPDTYLFPAPYPSTRTMCGYLISRRLVTSCLASHFQHFVFPIDWMLNLIMSTSSLPLSIFWCNSNYFSHGSKTGAYVPSVSPSL